MVARGVAKQRLNPLAVLKPPVVLLKRSCRMYALRGDHGEKPKLVLRRMDKHMKSSCC